MLILLALTFLLWTTPFAKAQGTPYALQVGAGGDVASRGNSGIAARIRTHVYRVSADYGNSFWVGDVLASGGFIQFGYQLSSAGYYCLYGETVGLQTICNGSADMVTDNDARWFWQYWPNSNVIDFFSGIGPAGSAGPDGSWHLYQILPNELNGWTFVLDGKSVSSINNFQWTPSRDPVIVVAEEVTGRATPSGRLGPVEFSDLSYSKEDGWHRVESLQAISACIAADASCSIPYGLRVLGANHIIAGTGEQPTVNGELLWTASFILDLSIPYRVKIFVDRTPYSSETLKLPLSAGVHTIAVPSSIEINATSRLRFQSWSDGSTDPSYNMNLSSNVSLEAVYVKQFRLTIVSPFLNVGEGWYDEGSTAEISAPSSQPVNGFLGALGAKLQFAGWYDNGHLTLASSTGTVKMDTAHVLVAQWTTDFTIPILMIAVILAAVGAVVITIRRKSKE